MSGFLLFFDVGTNVIILWLLIKHDSCGFWLYILNWFIFELIYSLNCSHWYSGITLIGVSKSIDCLSHHKRGSTCLILIIFLVLPSTLPYAPWVSLRSIFDGCSTLVLENQNNRISSLHVNNEVSWTILSPTNYACARKEKEIIAYVIAEFSVCTQNVTHYDTRSEVLWL